MTLIAIIQYFAIGVDHPSESVLLAFDRDDDFVEMPFICRSQAFTRDPAGKLPAKARDPVPHCPATLLAFFGLPSDIAAMAVWPASDDAEYATRQMFTIDGGDRLNATPRKCLGWKTPAEVFREKMMEEMRRSPYPQKE